jgi:general stress protein YciG
MAGTIVGGKQAAETNKERYGADFYKGIGRLGGLKSTGGGFAKNPELAREAGRKGGPTKSSEYHKKQKVTV